MPYIICVNQPGCLPEADPTAVATLEEAVEAARDEIHRNLPSLTDVWRNLLRDAGTLPEAGGTIGPLPDGYVIDVQKVTWSHLAEVGSLTPGRIRYVADPRYGGGSQYAQEILDAYNQN